MNLNTKGAPEISVASNLLVARLGELLIRKGVISRVEAALVAATASRDATAPAGYETGRKAMLIIEDVATLWAQTADDAP